MKTKKLTRLVFLVTMALIIEMIGLPQPFTGPLVNMMLIITTLILGPGGGIFMGLLTPLIAMFRGQLPPFLFPMVPFIILSNFLLVGVFYLIRKNFVAYKKTNPLVSLPDWVGLLWGAILKFAWLYMAAHFMLPILFGKTLSAKMLAAMSLPQLLTAILGGIMAFVIYNLLQTRIPFLSENE